LNSRPDQLGPPYKVDAFSADPLVVQRITYSAPVMASSASLRGAILQSPLLAPRLAVRRAPTTTRRRAVPAKISCIGWVRALYLTLLLPPLPAAGQVHADHLSSSLVSYLVVGWLGRRRQDPEGILGAPQGGHLARLEFRRRLERDSEAREAFERQVREERERRRSEREEMEDRLIELEAMQKVLLEGVEAYDKLQNDLVTAKERLMKILQSSDRKATLLEMVERNELNISILTLLDENIASAKTSDQNEAVAFMEDVRSSIVKYITV
ncbi:hypothetical protein BAE44_0017557, partial [Dichanthelium oligosanthes]